MTNGQQVLRRRFLKAGGALAGMLAFAEAPQVLIAGKAKDKPVIIGEGGYRYRWVDNWARLPAQRKFGYTHSIVQVADGRFFVHHTGYDSTAIFDPTGRFIEAWGGSKYVGNAHGMDLRVEHSQEVLYLAPTFMHKFFKTDLKGNVLMELNYPKLCRSRRGQRVYADAKRYNPTFTAFAPNGDFYITDGYGLGWIHHYDIQGKYLQSFGGAGNAPDQENCPHGIFCDTRNPHKPMLVVADRAHHRLQYFTFDGKLDHLVTNATPQQNQDGTGKLRLPCQFSQRGQWMLIPDLAGRTTLLDGANNVLTQLGDNPNVRQRANPHVPQNQLVPGRFCCPHGSCWDRHGNAYVVEWLPYGRVTKLEPIAT